MFRLGAWWLTACLVLLMSACGGGGGGSSSPPNPPSSSATISGLASKGPVLGATVTAYEVTSSGARGSALGSTTTNATTGTYSLAIDNYSGPVLLVLSGGSYTDEATQHTVQVPTAGLQAVIGSVTAGSSLTAQITPLTTMAEAQAAAMTGGLTSTNINAANTAVGAYFGGVSNGGTSIDILNTQPINPLVANSASGASQSAINYGLILAGFSQEAQTLNLTNPFDLVTALVKDFSDGKFNGYDGSTALTLEGQPMDPDTGTANLGAAISTFSGSASNVSGGTISLSIPPILSSPPNSYTVGGTLSGLSGTVVLSNQTTGDSLSLSNNGSFTFATKIVVGGAYNVTVTTQPSGLTCTVVHGSGNVGSANVTNVTVDCSAVTYTIGGTASGLNGNGLVLQDNGGDNLDVSSNGTFSFATSLASGSPYDVSEFTNPTTGETCTVTNGSGTVASANVTNVAVTCGYTVSATVSGLTGSLVLQDNGDDNLDISSNGTFTFATLLATSATYDVTVSTQPTGQTCSATNGSGTVGTANVSVGVTCSTIANDLWTWVSGSNVANALGVYGTKGVASASNVPGGRTGAVSWKDNSGNLWLFGGTGYDSAGTLGELNDLWKFDGTNWTWVSGSNVVNESGVYGTQGVASASNVPGGRTGAVSWRDNSGNLWLFGGAGYDSAGNSDDLNDLWKFDGINWTWVSGSNVVNALGIYGTQGVASASNVPGSRDSSVSWLDSNGNFWLFGGQGNTSQGFGYFSDLWKFDGTNWTWVSGSNVSNASGIYGTQGVAGSGNVPGARIDAVSWIDPNNNLWLFGGFGNDTQNVNEGHLNDLWKFDGVNWIWVSGSDAIGASGTYGTQGVPAASNVPGARHRAISWIDSHANLWLFGGLANDSQGNSGPINDLWKFDGTNWTWVSGSDVINASGSYGIEGVASSANVPPAKVGAVSWIDVNSNLWLFGGASTQTGGQNDLWEFQP